MCQFCSEANDSMEPNDGKFIGQINSEDHHVGSSTIHSVIPEDGIVEQEEFSSTEVVLTRPASSLTSISSFASNYSDYSVDANLNDGQYPEQGGFESGQDDPGNGGLSKSNSVLSVSALEHLDYLKDGQEGGKSGFRFGNADLRSASFKSTYDEDDSSSNDGSFDEANETTPPPTLDKDEIWVPPDAANKDSNTDHSVATLDDDDDDECCADSNGTEWAEPSLLDSNEEGVSIGCSIKEEKQKALDEVMNGKFKNLVGQQLKKLGVVDDNFDDGSEGNWVDIVTNLAWQAASFIKPDNTEPKGMDPAGYLKIKCIATGSPAESRLIKGLVFKKHAAHKHMATKYKNPKLLLIEGVLDQSSGSSGLSSFNSMITQEKGNLAVLLENLEECHPNVILVEKSASRDVVDGVLKLGVTLVHDMKRHRLERVSRCTGSLILSSNTTFNKDLGHCEAVYFEKFVEDHAIVGEGGKKPTKTLMFLEGCPKRLGCTILLNGSHSEELKKIKCVVQFAVVMAYNYILETSFLVDQKAMFSTFAYGIEAGISLNDEEPASVVFEHPRTSSNLQEPISDSASGEDPKAASSDVVDIPISNGFHEEEAIHVEQTTVQASEAATSNGFHDKASDNLVVDDTAASSNELNAASVTVSPSEEAPEGSNNDADGSSNDKSLQNNSQLSSSFSADPEDDGEDSVRPMDEINSLLDSESILVLKSCRNASKGTICEQSHFSHIKFYRNFDVPLETFLLSNLFSQSNRCKGCEELPDAHFYYYAHHSKQLTIRVKRLDKLSLLPGKSERKIWMWSRCGKCEPNQKVETKRVLISTAARALSFGKFLELSFSSHSSFNRLSSCGHSFQKDFLYFFGLGSMVAMFQYSRVARYKVSLPAQKLEFSNSVNKDWLQNEIECVYTKGLLLFTEISNYLKKIESGFSGSNHVPNGSFEGFSDVLALLKLERSEFEESIKDINITNEDSQNSVHKLLGLNQLRWEILLEARIWIKRLRFLQSVLTSSSSNRTVQKQTNLDDGPHTAEEKTAPVLEQTVLEQDENKVDDGTEEAPAEKVPEKNQTEEEGTAVTGSDETNASNVLGTQTTAESVPCGDNSSFDVQIETVTETDDIISAESSSSYAFERLASSMPSPNSEGPTLGWIWHPLSQIREKCRAYLRQDTVTDILPVLSQVVNEEGPRLRIPVDHGEYVVSDYDGEISSCVACALASVKDQSLPGSTPDSTSNENVTLKRATSEPSPNLSLKTYDLEMFQSAPSMPRSGSRFPSFDGLNWLDSMAEYGQIHPEVTLGIDRQSVKGKYSVVIMYAEKFRALRERCCPSELDYIASLSRCKIWDAKGGKSKSFFAKTLDDRLIIKEIKKIEFESFMKFAPNYFNHMTQSFEFGNQTCLAKILGIYQVTIRHAKSGRETKHDLMVQENLSFGRNVTRQYDLKGALHARFTATADGAGDVLLDQNFVNDMNSSPLYIGQRAKRLLQRAVWNDTTFLNSINVMDYSLLVGVDRQKKELVCGIIDYLRQYTWDKQLETWVKASLVVPKNVLPTIISPREYKKRFRKFMDTHFLTVPDHWCSHRPSNPCRLCGIKDDSSSSSIVIKQEEDQ